MPPNINYIEKRITMGLNDAFLLDDTAETPAPQVKINALKNTLPGQDPEMNDDVTLIGVNEQDVKELDEANQKDVIALEQAMIALADVIYAQQSLVSAKGISQSIALECQVALPGLVSDVRPMGSFTKQVTQINYKAALEEAEEQKSTAVQKVVAFIKSIAERIMAFIKKLFSGKTKEQVASEIKKDTETLKQNAEVDPQELLKKTAAAHKAGVFDSEDKKPDEQVKKVLDEVVAAQAAQKPEQKAPQPQAKKDEQVPTEVPTDVQVKKPKVPEVTEDLAVKLMQTNVKAFFDSKQLSALVLIGHKSYAADTKKFVQAVSDLLKHNDLREGAQEAIKQAETALADMRRAYSGLSEDRETFIEQLAKTVCDKEGYFFKDSATTGNNFDVALLLFAAAEATGKVAKLVDGNPDLATVGSEFSKVLSSVTGMLTALNSSFERYAAFVKKFKGSGSKPATESFKASADDISLISSIFDFNAAQEEIDQLIAANAALEGMDFFVSTASTPSISFKPVFKSSFMKAALEEDGSDKPVEGGEKPQEEKKVDKSKVKAIADWIKKIVEKVVGFVKGTFTKANDQKLLANIKKIEEAKPEQVDYKKLASVSGVEIGTAVKTVTEPEDKKVIEQSFLKKLEEKLTNEQLSAYFIVGSDKEIAGETFAYLDYFLMANKEVEQALAAPDGADAKELMRRISYFSERFRNTIKENKLNRKDAIEELYENIIGRKKSMFNKNVVKFVNASTGPTEWICQQLEKASSKVGSGSMEGFDAVALQRVITSVNNMLSDMSRIRKIAQSMSTMLMTYLKNGESSEVQASTESLTEVVNTNGPVSTTGLMLPCAMAQLYESELTNKQGSYAAAGMQMPTPAGNAEYYVSPPIANAVIANAGSNGLVTPAEELTARINTLQEALARVSEGQEPSMEALELLTADMLPRQSMKLMASIDNKKIDKELFAEALNQSMSSVNKDLAAFTASGTFSSGLARDLAKVTSKNFIFSAKPREATLDDVAAVKRKLDAEAAGILAGVGSSKTFSSVLDTIAAFGVFVKADIFSSSAFWTSAGQYDKKRRTMINNYDTEFVENYDEAVEIILKGILGQDKSFFKDHTYAYGKIIELLNQAGYFVEIKLKKYIQIAEDKGYEKDLAYFNEVNRVYEIAINDMIYAGRCIWFYTETKKEVLG